MSFFPYNKAWYIAVILVIKLLLIPADIVNAETDARNTMIRSVDFVGRVFYSEKELRNFAETKSGKIFGRSFLNEEKLTRDIARLADKYKGAGFLDVKVEPRVEQISDNIVDVTFVINAGRQRSKEEFTAFEESRRNDDLSIKIAQQEAAINLLTGYLETLKQEKNTLIGDKEGLEAEVKSLQTVLNVETAKKKDIEVKLNDMSFEFDSLRRENIVLKNKIDSVATVFQSKMDVINKAKDALITAVDEVDYAVKRELDVVEIKPIQIDQANKEKLKEYIPEAVIVPTVEKIEGKIVVVKQKLNFIIVNVGLGDGVKVGMRFNIMREGEQIAVADVIEVRDTVSALDVSNLLSGKELREGDVVVAG